MTKPSPRVVDDSTRGAAHRQRFNPSVDDLHPRIIQTADRRTDLARQPAPDRAVRPCLGPPAQRANGAAGEEVVGAQAGHRIARKEEHQPVLDEAEPGRAAGTHRDTVDRQAPCFATSAGARSSIPTLDPPDTMITSASARSASVIASASSGTRPGKSTTPPSRATSAASMGPFASAICQPCGREPAGRSSFPVITSRTRGLANTGIRAAPTELSTPKSCGSSTRPA